MSFNLEQANSGYASINSAGLAAGTNAGTFKTTATLNYTNDGKFLSKAATDNVPFSAGAKVVPANSAVAFSVWIDALGNLSTVQGVIAAAGEPTPVPAATSPEVAYVGYIKVTTNASTTFTPGTTSLAAAGVTSAFSSGMRLPGKAQ